MLGDQHFVYHAQGAYPWPQEQRRKQIWMPSHRLQTVIAKGTVQAVAPQTAVQAVGQDEGTGFSHYLVSIKGKIFSPKRNL